MITRVRDHLRGNAIAYLALFVALGGTAYAGVHLGRNSVGTKSIRKGAVTRAKLAPNSVEGSKVLDRSLTGADINVGTLGQVPTASQATDAGHAKAADKATNADHATDAAHASNADHAAVADNATKVGGLGVVKFTRKGASSVVTILSLGGLRFEYSCVGFPFEALSLTAKTDVDGAEIQMSRTAGGGATLEGDASFNRADGFPLVGFVGTGVYTAPDGAVVSFTYRNTTGCAGGVSGTAVGG